MIQTTQKIDDATSKKTGENRRNQFSEHALSPEQIEKIAAFKKQLALFFIEKGMYVGIRKTGEGFERIKKGHISKEERDVIEKIGLQNSYKSGLIDCARDIRWERITREEIIEITKRFIITIGKKVKDITRSDFEKYGLDPLLQKCYNKSIYTALVSTGYAYSYEAILKQSEEFIAAFKGNEDAKFNSDKIYPWEMERVPIKFWDEEKYTTAAVRWLVWKIKKEEGKEPKDIEARDFDKYRLGVLLTRNNRKEYKKLLNEAGVIRKEDEKVVLPEVAKEVIPPIVPTIPEAKSKRKISKSAKPTTDLFSSQPPIESDTESLAKRREILAALIRSKKG